MSEPNAEVIFEWLQERIARSCATCAHWLDESVTHKVGFCTSQISWHNGKAMPGHEMCSKWEKRDEMPA